MKHFKILIALLSVSIFISCSITRLQKKGHVLPENFDYQTAFTPYKTVIVIPAEINGQERNFIFDNGAGLTLLQRDSLQGKLSTVTGASKRSVKAGEEIIRSFKIGDINFIDTHARTTDMDGLKDQIPNFGGLIGQSIMSKANWLINYPDKTIRFSNKNLSDSTFEPIEITIKDGSPYTTISINGFIQKVNIDFGSSSEFSIPEDSKLAKELLNTYKFDDHQRERYTIGGNENITEKVAIIPSIKIGEIEFKNVETKINIQSKARIGISFFKEYQIYVDNINQEFKIKK